MSRLSFFSIGNFIEVIKFLDVSSGGARADLCESACGRLASVSIVPWKRGNGYARQALNLMQVEARRLGLACVELTVDPENIAAHLEITDCRCRSLLKNARIGYE